ncbi:MAG TPA: FG-GAP repeat protein, partial [Steroidobacteraceae bacterium]|nr:FG-GAP repeat protein [Steroidobacteraceae bacterium]
MNQMRPRVRLYSRAAAINASLLFISITAHAQSGVRAPADFNADGYADLAVGVPNESFACARLMQVQAAGVVHVVYGKPAGKAPVPRTFANQLLARQCTRVTPAARSLARFGSALAYGDFNNDGFDDLAVGVPDAGSLTGSVDVYRGSAGG